MQQERDMEVDRQAKELESMQYSGKSSAEIEYLHKKQEQRYHEMQDKIRDERKRQLEAFEKASNEKLSEIKMELNDYIDDCSTQIIKDLRKKIGDICKTSAGVIADLVAENIEGQLLQRKKEMAIQTESLQSSEHDKAERLEKTQTRLEKVNALLSDAIEFETAIEAQTPDELEIDSL
jgi:hypothetical protein